MNTIALPRLIPQKYAVTLSVAMHAMLFAMILAQHSPIILDHSFAPQTPSVIRVSIAKPQEVEPTPKKVTRPHLDQPVVPPKQHKEPEPIVLNKPMIPVTSAQTTPTPTPEITPQPTEEESTAYLPVEKLEHVGQNKKPRYPKRAKRMGIEGDVLVQVWVNDIGYIEEIQIVQSSGHAILDRQTVKDIAKWQFKPMIVNGKAISTTATFPVSFRLTS